MRVSIPVSVLEFEDNGNTLWIHGPAGGTILRIKTTGRIKTSHCKVSPNSHADMLVKDDINICLSGDANPCSDGAE